MAKGDEVADGIEVVMSRFCGGEICLDYPGGSCAIGRVLKCDRGRRERQHLSPVKKTSPTTADLDDGGRDPVSRKRGQLFSSHSWKRKHILP